MAMYPSFSGANFKTFALPGTIFGCLSFGNKRSGGQSNYGSNKFTSFHRIILVAEVIGLVSFTPKL
jgi:hypothetical protein